METIGYFLVPIIGFAWATSLCLKEAYKAWLKTNRNFFRRR